ncbi:hypothetical protein ACIPEN_02220 [Herbaspirillum chlorophenolicum]|uniref:Uncharacterized protein n=1 Tax=Herbaspirillum chlorophenolicum TaxID=211589 RepID=A0ABW8ET36_9BURK
MPKAFIKGGQSHAEPSSHASRHTRTSREKSEKPGTKVQVTVPSFITEYGKHAATGSPENTLYNRFIKLSATAQSIPARLAADTRTYQGLQEQLAQSDSRLQAHQEKLDGFGKMSESQHALVREKHELVQDEKSTEQSIGLTDVEKSIDSYYDERKDLKEKRHEYKHDLSSLKRRHDRNEIRKSDYKNRSQALDKKIAQFTSEMDDIDVEIATLKKQRDGLRNELPKYDEKFTALNNKLDAAGVSRETELKIRDVLKEIDEEKLENNKLKGQLKAIDDMPVPLSEDGSLPPRQYAQSAEKLRGLLDTVHAELAKLEQQVLDKLDQSDSDTESSDDDAPTPSKARRRDSAPAAKSTPPAKEKPARQSDKNDDTRSVRAGRTGSESKKKAAPGGFAGWMAASMGMTPARTKASSSHTKKSSAPDHHRKRDPAAPVAEKHAVEPVLEPQDAPPVSVSAAVAVTDNASADAAPSPVAKSAVSSPAPAPTPAPQSQPPKPTAEDAQDEDTPAPSVTRDRAARPAPVVASETRNTAPQQDGGTPANAAAKNAGPKPTASTSGATSAASPPSIASTPIVTAAASQTKPVTVQASMPVTPSQPVPAVERKQPAATTATAEIPAPVSQSIPEAIERAPQKNTAPMPAKASTAPIVAADKQAKTPAQQGNSVATDAEPAASVVAEAEKTVVRQAVTPVASTVTKPSPAVSNNVSAAPSATPAPDATTAASQPRPLTAANTASVQPAITRTQPHAAPVGANKSSTPTSASQTTPPAVSQAVPAVVTRPAGQASNTVQAKTQSVPATPKVQQPKPSAVTAVDNATKPVATTSNAATKIVTPMPMASTGAVDNAVPAPSAASTPVAPQARTLAAQKQDSAQPAPVATSKPSTSPTTTRETPPVASQASPSVVTRQSPSAKTSKAPEPATTSPTPPVAVIKPVTAPDKSATPASTVVPKVTQVTVETPAATVAPSPAKGPKPTMTAAKETETSQAVDWRNAPAVVVSTTPPSAQANEQQATPEKKTALPSPEPDWRSAPPVRVTEQAPPEDVAKAQVASAQTAPTATAAVKPGVNRPSQQEPAQPTAAKVSQRASTALPYPNISGKKEAVGRGALPVSSGSTVRPAAAGASTYPNVSGRKETTGQPAPVQPAAPEAEEPATRGYAKVSTGAKEDAGRAAAPETAARPEMYSYNFHTLPAKLRQRLGNQAQVRTHHRDLSGVTGVILAYVVVAPDRPKPVLLNLDGYREIAIPAHKDEYYVVLDTPPDKLKQKVEALAAAKAEAAEARKQTRAAAAAARNAGYFEDGRPKDETPIRESRRYYGQLSSDEEGDETSPPRTRPAASTSRRRFDRKNPFEQNPEFVRTDASNPFSSNFDPRYAHAYDPSENTAPPPPPPPFGFGGGGMPHRNSFNTRPPFSGGYAPPPPPPSWSARPPDPAQYQAPNFAAYATPPQPGFGAGSARRASTWNGMPGDVPYAGGPQRAQTFPSAPPTPAAPTEEVIEIQIEPISPKSADGQPLPKLILVGAEWETVKGDNHPDREAPKPTLATAKAVVKQLSDRLSKEQLTDLGQELSLFVNRHYHLPDRPPTVEQVYLDYVQQLLAGAEEKNPERFAALTTEQVTSLHDELYKRTWETHAAPFMKTFLTQKYRNVFSTSLTSVEGRQYASRLQHALSRAYPAAAASGSK